MMEFWLNRGLVCVLMLLLVSFAQGQTANHRATDPEAPAVAPPLALVNVMQGTDSERAFSHGNTLPLVGAPWGLTDWSVQNREGINERWFYQSRNTMFYGFRATHSPCPWAGDYGHFMVSPQTGPVLKSVADGGCEYDPAKTVMRPDYARVQLNRYHLTAELTASERCSMLRLQFNTGQPGNAAQPSADKTGRLVFDFPGGAQLIAQGNRIWGYSQYHGGAAEGDFHCYFVGELDRAVTAASQVGTAQTPGAGAGYIEFDLSRPTVEIKLATSYISPEQAWRNLEIETRGGFEAMRERTAVAWGEKLNRISVDGTPEQRATFYSCLYRTMKFPHKLYEMDAGQKPIHYSPWDGKIHPGVAYTDSGLWDTFRTLFPFYSIVYPQQLSEIVSGWLNAYREGGWLPEWPNPGGFRGMPGSHANAMVVDAMAKGITGFDYNTAYEALHHDAFDIPLRSKHPGGRAGLGVYLKLGYLPPKAAEYWVSNTLDYAYDDWCVAQAAKLMHQTADYQTLMQRSLNYRNLWDPAVQFMRSKDANGQWSDSNFDEFAWGGAYAESGPWQASWAVQHDVLGLADLVGGPAAFGEKLDRLFHQPSVFHTGAYGGEIHEMTEFAAVNMGQFAANNQPSFHLPYLYAAIGQPWKTEYWTRRACSELFNPGPDGYSGDEDNGSNGAWYLLSSMGIYPLTPGVPQYVLTSPLFNSVKISLSSGKAFTISALHNSPQNVYVNSRTLNGQPDANAFITQSQISNGGALVNQMSDKPAERKLLPAELPYSAKTEMLEHK